MQNPYASMPGPMLTLPQAAGFSRSRSAARMSTLHLIR